MSKCMNCGAVACDDLMYFCSATCANEYDQELAEETDAPNTCGTCGSAWSFNHYCEED